MNWHIEMNDQFQTTPAPIITLTTDFGLGDGYVAAIKGVILSRMPTAAIVDLCHEIAPHDIAQAAWVVKDTFSAFPPGSIHVIVVDPGVGSGRAIVGMAAHGHCFLAPDNGILSTLIEPKAKACQAQRPDLYQHPLSHTFHGRDIFAPLAAHLASGHPLESIGPSVPLDHLQPLSPPTPTVDLSTRQITGCVTRIDHFGNLITNISATELQQLGSPPATVRICLGPLTLSSWCTHYNAVAPGQPLILLNSANLVEIAINQGHAASSLGVRIHTPFVLSVCAKDNYSL